MAENTGISWTTHSWNPTRGCKVVSPGCTNCYAMNLADRIPGYEGLTQRTPKGYVAWNGEVKLVEDRLKEPFKWERKALKTGETIRVFVDSMSDLFYERIPLDYVDRVFTVMEECPHVIFQVLTKRPDRMQRYSFIRYTVPGEGSNPPPNIWLGTSVEDQQRANERLLSLIHTPAAVRFLSCEPLIGPLDLRRIEVGKNAFIDALTCDYYRLVDGERDVIAGPPLRSGPVDWAIIGGESGAGFRPMDLDWARSLRDQCQATGVPFFYKQGASRFPGKNTLLDGREWHEFPGDVLAQEAV